MSGALFTEAEAWNEDPLNPGWDNPTPASVVASLAASQRSERVERLVEMAHAIYDQGVATWAPDKTVVASCVLFSGGNDSTTLAHLFRGKATHAIHANTTIGIEATRQYVRDTCASWGLPLIEETAPISYRDLVLERGFPGPAMHFKMYSRLKERALDAARHRLGVAGSQTKVAVYIAGRRRQESERRSDIPLHEPDGSVVWVSPLALWTKPDMNTYRLMHRTADPVPVNEVSDLLHMSGECLCGAYAHPGELDEIGEWYPEVREEIEQLQRDATAAGWDYPYNTWGHGQGAPSKRGRLCSSCTPGQMDIFEAAS